MHPLIETRREQIAAICREYRVRRLDVFGSACRADFDLQRSDVDLVVEFDSESVDSQFDRYFGLKQSLETLFSRPVDLVEMESLRGSRLRKHLERERVLIYGQAA